MSREVMKRALEALEGRAVNRYMERLDETIAALRTALAEPEGEHMTKKDIIRMAREAGGTDRRTGWWDIHTDDLEHLVALVTERDTALLRQALEALEYYRSGGEAITALRERLGEKV